MTLQELHDVCAQLAREMRGAPRVVLLRAVNDTAPAAAWARSCAADPNHELTDTDIDRIVKAFGQLAEAMAATGLRLHDEGMHAAAWNVPGRVAMGRT